MTSMLFGWITLSNLLVDERKIVGTSNYVEVFCTYSLAFKYEVHRKIPSITLEIDCVIIDIADRKYDAAVRN